MNRRSYEEERLRSVHLSMVIILTVCVAAVCFSAVSLQWAEIWMLPFLIGGALFCWVLHVRQMYSSDVRLRFYAGMSMAVIMFDGVHPTSIFDFAISVVLALALFSQTTDRRILDLCLVVYAFLLANHIVLLVRGQSTAPTGHAIAEMFVHTVIVFAVYRIAVRIVSSRILYADTEEREIEHLSEMKKNTEDFLTNLSHELRTPINAISGVGFAMLRDARSEASVTRAGLIASAGKELSDQIEEMLDYTEIDTGRLVITDEPYMISSVINDVATECGFLGRDIAERITIIVSKGIPEKLSGGGKWIRKLLRHQIEACANMGGEGEIAASVYSKEREYGINLCMEVSCTGGACARDTVLRIIGASEQDQGEASASWERTDLKLRIIYGITHAMGGFVRLINRPEEGTILRVSIPQHVLREGKDADPKRTEHHVIRVKHESVQMRREHSTPSLPVPEGLRALIVDDEPLNLVVAGSILSDYAMITETAESGEEAIGKVRETHFDLIFMDHMMPVMDGVEAAHRIRDILAAQGRETAIIALTANAVSGAKEMFLREGFDAFVAKPIVRTELERELKGILRDKHGETKEKPKETEEV